MKRLLLIVVALAVCGCSPSQIGAVKGSLTLTATFADAQNLVPGHSVQMADVKVGSVTRVELVSGYRARVTMSIEDGFHVPTGTSAEIAQTSLLGENYVKLTLPPGRPLSQGPYLNDHAQITQTSDAPQFETVVGNAGRILQAISADDVGTLVNEGASALGGQGDRLHQAVATSGDLIALLSGQRKQIGFTIDRLAHLARTLAADKHAFDTDQIAKSTALIRANKQKILNAVTKATTTARLLNDQVFVHRADELRTLVQHLDSTLQTLAGGRWQITDLVDNIVGFEQAIPKAVHDGQLLVSAVLKVGLYNAKPTSIRPQLDRLLGGTR